MDPNEQMVRAESLVGPQIGGMVHVQLSELDRLRADYVRAVKTAQELASHAKEIKITISTGDSSKNKFVKDAGLKEVLHYKGLDEVRSIIAEEEREKLVNEFTSLTKVLEQSRQETFAALEVQRDLKEQILRQRDEHLEERRKLNTKVRELELLVQERDTTIKEMTSVAETLEIETKSLTNEYNNAISNLEKLREQFNNLSSKYAKLKPFWKLW